MATSEEIYEIVGRAAELKVVFIKMVDRILRDSFSPQEPQASKHPPVFGAVQREHPLFTGYGVLSVGG